MNKRFAVPVTCIIFAVIGLAFGVYNQRAGRSFGLLLGLVLTTIFYVLTLGGEKSARSGAIPAWLGIWGPNIVFAVFGIWTTLRQALPRWAQLGALITAMSRRRPGRQSGDAPYATSRASAASGWFRFPRLVDHMILSDLVGHVAFVVAGMTVIFLIFTAFEPRRRDRTEPNVRRGRARLPPLPRAADHRVYGAARGARRGHGDLRDMARGSQIVALKASGQSIYRMAVPVFGLALALSAGLFVLEN